VALGHALGLKAASNGMPTFLNAVLYDSHLLAFSRSTSNSIKREQTVKCQLSVGCHRVYSTIIGCTSLDVKASWYTNVMLISILSTLQATCFS
jgi:hypothetical protein